MRVSLISAIAAVALLIVATISNGCKDDKTVDSPPRSLAGEYTGSYRFIQIESETDTTANNTLTAHVVMTDSLFELLLSDGWARPVEVVCTCLGTYSRSDGSIDIVTDTLEYTRGVCDETFGKGGHFHFEQTARSLVLSSDARWQKNGGVRVRTIKLLNLTRSK